MHNHELQPLINDPDLSTTAAARALLALAKSVSRGDPDIAGDVTILLTERLKPGGSIYTRLGTHANPAALLTIAAKNAAAQAHESAGRHKRVIPLTDDGDLAAIEPAPSPYSPTFGIFDLLGDLGWTMAHLEMLAIPRKRPGRCVHPGIEAALERVATCFGIPVRCPGCPTDMELLRLDLRGPTSWPHLVPVLLEWGWDHDVITLITTSPANIAQWRDLDIRPPARQERRMVEIARKMRVEPWLLQDSQAIRDSVRSARSTAPRIHIPTPQGWGACEKAS
ncbi:MAG: hypothetical protein PHU75_00900 [Candidatus Nanopelagicales bacterium]|nr:hypothetical protein [Candidatus Nanopelagicales bacterium]